MPAPAFRRITLGMPSSLEALGQRRRRGGAGRGGIATNVLAACHHDHVFVPEARAAEAFACLQRLGARGR